VRYLLRGEAPSEVLHAVAAPRRALPCLSDHLVSGCSGMGGRLHTPHPSYLGPSPQLDAQRELGHHLCHPGGAACARRERCFTFREQIGANLHTWCTLVLSVAVAHASKHHAHASLSADSNASRIAIHASTHKQEQLTLVRTYCTRAKLRLLALTAEQLGTMEPLVPWRCATSSASSRISLCALTEHVAQQP